MEQFQCTLCETEQPEDKKTPGDICQSCRAQLGLVPPTEPMRPPAPCVRCNGTTFVRVRLRERASRIEQLSGLERRRVNVAVPLTVTFPLADKFESGFWSVRKVGRAPDIHGPAIGALQAYVCRKCGYTELYTQRPMDIPIGEEYGTELWDVGGDSPYR